MKPDEFVLQARALLSAYNNMKTPSGKFDILVEIGALTAKFVRKYKKEDEC